jgi:DNA-binding IclR family transcriptional regulator
MNNSGDAGAGKYSASAVKYAAEILKLMAVSGRPLGTSEIARATESSRSLVFRVRHELEAAGFVERHGQHEFWLGMAVLELGGAYASQWDFSQTRRRFMAELAAEIGETVNFAVLDGSEIVYVL